MSTIANNMVAPPDNFSTTLSAGINSGDLTIPLNSVAGLATEGVGVIFSKDANGLVLPASIEFVHWTNISGSNLTLSDVGDRGLTGSASGAQAHASGSYFEVWVTSKYYNSQRAGFVLEHNQDGTHKDAAVKDTALATVIHAGTSKTTPVDADELSMYDSVAGLFKKLTWANLKATLKTYFDTLYVAITGGSSTNQTLTTPTITTPVIKDWNGWGKYDAVIPTRASADDPTYVLTFGGVNLTGIMSVGQKVKFTQNSSTIFGIITALSFSTNTTMTLYCGTDYDVLDTATYAISGFYYSAMRTPQGFPMNPTKWSVELLDQTLRTQTSPAANTFYNLGSLSLSVPIGAWRLSYYLNAYAVKGSASAGTMCPTLSTANNSESDADFTVRTYATVDNVIPVYKEKYVLLAAKTTYYLNASPSDIVTQTSINFYGVSSPASGKTIIRAICAYL